MNIGLIGSGSFGAALGRRFTKAGHALTIANSRGPESIKELARELEARAVSLLDVASNSDLLIIAIPFKNIPDLPKNVLAGLPERSIVVDTCNYYPSIRDGVIATIEKGLTHSEWVAKQLGHSVVKAFNNILKERLIDGRQPNGQNFRIALPVAGDDSESKAKIITVMDTLAFDGLDAGTLQESWRQQPGTPSYCTDLRKPALTEALASADRSSSPEMAIKVYQSWTSLPPGATADDLMNEIRRAWPNLVI
jgi:predicted dinucleotide-binding enzyme